MNLAPRRFGLGLPYKSARRLLKALLLSAVVWSLPVSAENDAPLHSQSAFGKYVKKIYRQDNPKSRAKLRDKGRQLKVDGLAINLVNLYRYLKLQGEDWDQQDAEIRRFLASGNEDYISSQSWQEIKPSIVPRLVPSDYLETNADFVYEPVVDEFALAYAIDFPDAYVYVLVTHLQRWGIAQAELHQTALANLEVRYKDSLVNSDSTTDQDSELVVELGDLSATAIMLPSFRAGLIDRLGSPFLATMSSGHQLTVWRSGSADDATNRVRAQSEFQSAPQPISPEVYIVSETSLRTDHSKAVVVVNGQAFVMDFGDDEAAEPESEISPSTEPGDQTLASPAAGDCDLAASSIAYMTAVETLTDRVATGQIDQSVVQEFFAETEHMGPLMTSDPSLVCRQLDGLRPRYNLEQ